jgi:hypothetical protein
MAAWLGLGLFLAMAGCLKQEQPGTAVIEVSDWSPLAIPVQIVAGSQTAGPFSSRNFSFPIPPGTTWVKARALFPCGWKEVIVPLQPPSDQQVRDARQAGLPPAMHGTLVLFSPERMVKLWVDNSKGPAVRFAVGQMEVALPSDAARAMAIPAPQCENAALKLDGKDVGAWPAAKPASPKDKLPSDYLLDAAGGRCYHMQDIFYSKLPFGPSYEVLNLDLRGQRLYPLPKTVDYFLAPAPATVQVKVHNDIEGIAAEAVKTQLLETACR